MLCLKYQMNFNFDGSLWCDLCQQLQEKEVLVLREDQLQAVELRNELTKLRSVEQTSKLTTGRMEELEAVVQRLMAELENERKEREHIAAERESLKREKDEVHFFYYD